MNHSFETDLQVVLRALGDVVLPALGAAEKHVVEQLHLSMVALDFMRQRLPDASRYYRRELIDYTVLGDAAAALLASDNSSQAGELQSLAASGRVVLQTATSDWSDYIEATRKLRCAIARAVEASAMTPYEQQLDGLVLDSSSDIHRRARTWYLPFGFELRPQDLPDLNV